MLYVVCFADVDCSTHFLDTAKGIVTLRAFGTLSEERAKSLELLDRSQRPFYLLIVAQQWLTLVSQVPRRSVLAMTRFIYYRCST